MALEDTLRLLEVHQDRPERERSVDESLEAEITTNPEKWLSAPDEFDFQGVDTPNAESQRDVLRFNEGEISLGELGERL